MVEDLIDKLTKRLDLLVSWRDTGRQINPQNLMYSKGYNIAIDDEIGFLKGLLASIEDGRVDMLTHVTSCTGVQ